MQDIRGLNPIWIATVRLMPPTAIHHLWVFRWPVNACCSWFTFTAFFAVDLSSVLFPKERRKMGDGCMDNDGKTNTRPGQNRCATAL